jgi:hypothetical protein
LDSAAICCIVASQALSFIGLSFAMSLYSAAYLPIGLSRTTSLAVAGPGRSLIVASHFALHQANLLIGQGTPFQAVIK